ncbi:MAG: flavodoxin family protein [Ignavibacteriaceae bacterium]|nr:flavodoxin family protein [Ignavibacteriaceae bacterium]
MKKALIIFQSKNSATKKFGEEIAEFLLNRGLKAELIPLNSFEPKKLEGADYLLLSGWKSDSLIISNKPDNEWMAFIKRLPTLNGIKTALFATYKIFPGGIIRRMKKYLESKCDDVAFALKSRDGSLSIDDKLALNDFIR